MATPHDQRDASASTSPWTWPEDRSLAVDGFARFGKFNYPPVSHIHSFIHSSSLSGWATGVLLPVAAAISQLLNGGPGGGGGGASQSLVGDGNRSERGKSFCFKFGSKSEGGGGWLTE